MINASAHSLFLTWRDIHQAIFTLQDRLLSTLVAPVDKYTFVAVSRGGLIPMGLLAYQMNIRDIETVCVQSYTNRENKLDTFQIIKPFSKRVARKEHVVVIDDLSDTGQTFRQLRQFLPDAHYASLYTKPDGAAYTDTYTKSVAQNMWLVFPWDVD